MEREILAQNIRRYRKSAGMTQKTLAKKISLTPDTISLLELGRQKNPGLKYLIAISRELNVKLFQLFMENSEDLNINLIVSDQNVENLQRILDKIEIAIIRK
ncbi:hypothetical protein ES705_12717 [subsurface metagenome]